MKLKTIGAWLMWLNIQDRGKWVGECCMSVSHHPSPRLTQRAFYDQYHYVHVTLECSGQSINNTQGSKR